MAEPLPVVPGARGTCVAAWLGMYVALDPSQAEVLRELLESSLTQLRTETARADSRDFRDMLHRRERVIEQLLSKLSVAGPTVGM